MSAATDQILGALRALRSCTRAPEGVSAREKAEQFSVYAERLMSADPRDVLVACEEHSRTCHFWPTWAELVKLLGEARQDRIALEVRPLAAPKAAAEDGALLAEPDGQRALRLGVGRPWLLARRKGHRLSLPELAEERRAAEAEFAALPAAAPAAAQLRKLWAERVAQEATLHAAHLQREPAPA